VADDGDTSTQDAIEDRVVATVSLPPANNVGLVKIEQVAVHRERLRGTIALGLLVLLGAVAILPILASIWRGASRDDLETLMTLIFPSLIGVFGAVTGFYFGGERN